MTVTLYRGPNLTSHSALVQWRFESASYSQYHTTTCIQYMYHRPPATDLEGRVVFILWDVEGLLVAGDEGKLRLLGRGVAAQRLHREVCTAHHDASLVEVLEEGGRSSE